MDLTRNKSFNFNTDIFCNITVHWISLLQVPTSHVYPCGQQWSPSLQKTASGRRQQPHCPEESLQHIHSSGHSDWSSGQRTLPTSVFFSVAGTLTKGQSCFLYREIQHHKCIRTAMYSVTATNSLWKRTTTPLS